jgi:hypothetical protein
MTSKKKPVDPIPEEFGSYEEAAEFWDSHDTTEYLADSQPIKAIGELRERHYEIEIEAAVAVVLRKEAKRRGITPGHLASELLRQRLSVRQ